MIPNWFKKELSLINPKYFAIYDERRKIVFIRKWLTNFARPRTWRTDSEMICKVGYSKLDGRILHNLRKGLYWARHVKQLVQQLDTDNADMVEKSDIEHEYISRYMAKRIWSYYKEKTLDYGNPAPQSNKAGFGEF